jgi:haloalkane dehalogenase
MFESKMAYTKHFKTINGKKMAYVEVGQGDPIVLLHGNPTSSYLWRNIIPYLENKGRVIVPDLVGQGDSEKLPPSDGPQRYSFKVVYDYLSALLESLGVVENVTLVIHDWGSALGFYWAQHNSNAVKGIAYMEAIVCPLEWRDWPESAQGIFKGFRSEKGEDMILQRNLFVEAVLPSSVIRKLTEEEMAHYRAPFLSSEDRQPTLNWPRQIPIDGEPAAMVDLVTGYGQWMSSNDSPPKLFINADPGSILTGRARDFCRSWSHQTEVTVPGTHFIQEDSPDEIGAAVASWLSEIA